MQRDVCVRFNLYPPLQENPRLEVVELQDSASPYHEWNTQVTAGNLPDRECHGICLWIAVAVNEKRSFEAQYAINTTIPPALESPTAESKPERHQRSPRSACITSLARALRRSAL